MDGLLDGLVDERVDFWIFGWCLCDGAFAMGPLRWGLCDGAFAMVPLRWGFRDFNRGVRRCRVTLCVFPVPSFDGP
tara:strand:+ start:265 stop:492 length:228 start_codon:yes stop_codon:yes gene_type:complete